MVREASRFAFPIIVSQRIPGRSPASRRDLGTADGVKEGFRWNAKRPSKISELTEELHLKDEGKATEK
jgi:hypothetical protein